MATDYQGLRQLTDRLKTSIDGLDKTSSNMADYENWLDHIILGGVDESVNVKGTEKPTMARIAAGLMAANDTYPDLQTGLNHTAEAGFFFVIEGQQDDGYFTELVMYQVYAGEPVKKLVMPSYWLLQNLKEQLESELKQLLTGDADTSVSIDGEDITSVAKRVRDALVLNTARYGTQVLVPGTTTIDLTTLDGDKEMTYHDGMVVILKPSNTEGLPIEGAAAVVPHNQISGEQGGTTITLGNVTWNDNVLAEVWFWDGAGSDPSSILVTDDKGISRTLGNWADGINYTYTNVASMVADSTLQEGINVRTVGYYHIMDDGGTQYEISSTQYTHGIKLDNGLFANPQFGYEINFRQLGIQSGDDIYTYFEYAPNFPNHEFIVPPGEYMWTGSKGYLEFTEGTYKFKAQGKVDITCTSSSSSSEYLACWYAPFRGFDSSVSRLQDVVDNGKATALSAQAKIGSKTITLESIPDGVAIGDQLYLYCTRQSLGENRSYYLEGQVAIVAGIDGKTITLNESTFFNYSCGFSMTGTIGSPSKDDNGYWTLPITMDDNASPDDWRDYMGQIKFESSGASGGICAYNSVDGILYAYSGSGTSGGFSGTPTEGEKFTISIDSYAVFAAPVTVEFEGDFKFILDYENSTSPAGGNSLFYLRNMYRPKASGLRSKYFATASLQFYNCYYPSAPDCYLDGSISQNTDGGISTAAIEFIDCMGGQAPGTTILGYNQGINIQGNYLSSIKNVLGKISYFGGQKFADGTVSTVTNGIGCEHGGAYLTIWEHNHIHDPINAFNTMRGRQSTIRFNHIYGKCTQIVNAWGHCGLDVYGNKYHQTFNTGETDAAYDQDDDPILMAFVFLDHTVYDYNILNSQLYTNVFDNQTDVISGPFVALHRGTSEAELDTPPTYYNVGYWGNKILSTYPTEQAQTGFCASLPNMHATVYTSNFLNGPGNDMINKHSGTYRYVYQNRDFTRVQPVAGSPERYGDHSYYMRLEDDTAVRIFLDTSRRACIVDLMDESTVNSDLVAAFLPRASTTDSYSYKGKNIDVLADPLTGTTGTDGHVSISMVMVSDNGEASDDGIYCIYIENRLGSTELFKLNIR